MNVYIKCGVCGHCISQKEIPKIYPACEKCGSGIDEVFIHGDDVIPPTGWVPKQSKLSVDINKAIVGHGELNQ